MRGWYYATGSRAGLFIWAKNVVQKNLNNVKKTTETFILQAQTVHGDKYDYSVTEYVQARQKVRIRCKKHGEFWQVPHHHLAGRGCYECGREIVKKARLLTLSEFITRARVMHKGRYDYSKVIYKNNMTKITIICPIHGEWKQTPAHHLSNKGCPACWLSKGEERINTYLKQIGIEVKRQKIFDTCKDKSYLPFDFYFRLGNGHILIEYDGEGHYKDNFWGGPEQLKQIQRRDAIKTRFAQDNGFILIRIPYTVKNIEAHLQAELEKYLPDLEGARRVMEAIENYG